MTDASAAPSPTRQASAQDQRRAGESGSEGRRGAAAAAEGGQGTGRAKGACGDTRRRVADTAALLCSLSVTAAILASGAMRHVPGRRGPGAVTAPRSARLLVSAAAAAAPETAVLLALLTAALVPGWGGGLRRGTGRPRSARPALAVGLLVLARAGAVAV